jgi:hypothetical protein
MAVRQRTNWGRVSSSSITESVPNRFDARRRAAYDRAL